MPRTVKDLKPGDHLCFLYETEDEHRSVVLPFLREGLERGEKVVYVLSVHSMETILEGVRAVAPGVEGYLECGQLSFLRSEELYSGEITRNPDGMIALLREKTDHAMAEGYNALRVCSEMSWALRRDRMDCEHFLEYEARLNDFFAGSNCLAMCQYDRGNADSALLLDVLCTHPLVAVGAQIYENIYSSPASAGFGQDRHTAKLNYWLDNLTKHHRLQQAQKMEAMGTLAGGIAHDLNNILACIMGFTEMAIQDLPAQNRTRNDLVQVLNSAIRAKELVKQILAFSRRSEQERRPIEVGPIVEEALRLIRASIPSTIEIRRHIPPDDAGSGMIYGEPTQIHQVLMNLCSNAAHAMRDKGGVLEIGLSRVDLESRSMPHLSDLSPGSYLKLTVSDTGCGIDRTSMERIFDPFFTTKGPDCGTGLGLSVVYGIVKGYGGTITVESEPGMGSLFEVYLPGIEPDPPEEAPMDEPPSAYTGTERILLVDDEEILVQMGQQMLERLGYQCTTAISGVEALEVFREQQDELDLVITDYTMPRMTGLELAEELLRIRPRIPIILCTGYSEAITSEKAKAAGVCGFLMKPLAMVEMAKSIRRVLETV